MFARGYLEFIDSLFHDVRKNKEKTKAFIGNIIYKVIN